MFLRLNAFASAMSGLSCSRFKKDKKKWTETKTKILLYGLRRKSEHFWGNLGNLCFTSNLESSYNTRLKSGKKITKTKAKTFQHGLGKEMNISEISEIPFLPYTQNGKLRFQNLGKTYARFPRFRSFLSFWPGFGH